jgi:hypothetical protein
VQVTVCYVTALAVAIAAVALAASSNAGWTATGTAAMLLLFVGMIERPRDGSRVLTKPAREYNDGVGGETPPPDSCRGTS